MKDTEVRRDSDGCPGRVDAGIEGSFHENIAIRWIWRFQTTLILRIHGNAGQAVTTRKKKLVWLDFVFRQRSAARIAITICKCRDFYGDWGQNLTRLPHSLTRTEAANERLLPDYPTTFPDKQPREAPVKTAELLKKTTT